MILQFKRIWGKYKIGTVTDAIPDGVATTLIRVGKAVEVKGENHDNRSQSTDSSHGADSRTDNAGGSETPVVSGGVGHKPRSRANQPNSSRS